MNRWFNELALWGAFAGVAGSMLDSLLGATLQETVYSLTRKKVRPCILTESASPFLPVSNSSACFSVTNVADVGEQVMLEGHGSRPGTPAGEDEEIKVVSGIDVLTNNQVCPTSVTPIRELDPYSFNRSTLSQPPLWH